MVGIFFRQRQEINPLVREQIIAVWSPGGCNTAKISWYLATQAAKYCSTALVELPCLGIPRLAVEAGLNDRHMHTDAAILDYERSNGSPMSQCHKPEKNLSVLAANPYALPDHPVVHKVTVAETLHSFPGFFANEARRHGYELVIFDCQGVLVSPMTFFALRLAAKIILVVNEPSDISWSLNNKERLIETYRINESSFLATTLTNNQFQEEIRQVLKCPVLPKEKLLSLILGKEASSA